MITLNPLNSRIIAVFLLGFILAACSKVPNFESELEGNVQIKNTNPAHQIDVYYTASPVDNRARPSKAEIEELNTRLSEVAPDNSFKYRVQLKLTSKITRDLTITLPYDRDIEISENGTFHSRIYVSSEQFKADFEKSLDEKMGFSKPIVDREWNDLVSYSRSIQFGTKEISLGSGEWNRKSVSEDLDLSQTKTSAAPTILDKPDNWDLVFYLPPSAPPILRDPPVMLPDPSAITLPTGAGGSDFPDMK